MSKKPFGASTLCVILGLVFIALLGIRTISTPEIWTHLAQGRINAPISYLTTDTAVNTTHLYDKVSYALWNAGGAPLLIIVNVIGLLLAFILLLQVSKKWGGGISQGFALLVSGHLIFQNVDVSPQTMMMLFIALFVYLLSTAIKPVILFGALIPLQILWTNTHGSFLFGPFIAVLAAIQAAQNAKGTRRKKQQGGLPAGLLGALSVALLVATVVNPYFLKLHAQVIANIQMPYPAYWSSLFNEYFQTPARDPLIFFVFILGASGLITLKKKLPIMLTTLAILGAFIVIRSVYTAQLFAVLAFPFMILSFTAVGEYLSGSFKTLLEKQEKILEPATQAVFALLILLSIVPVVSNCAYTKFGSASSFGLGIEEGLYPAGAEAIIGHPAFPEKTINLAADGGYLAWTYPNRKIFIDYRLGRYDRELLENLNAMLLGNAKAYDVIYETYRPEAIIINTLTPAAAQGIVTLLARPIWKLAYFDGTTAILLLNKKEFAAILNNTEAQAAGLAKLEAARADYAAQVGKGCPGNPAELIGSGKVFLALNRPVESKAIFALLLQGNNTIPGAWIGLGNSQLMLKEFVAAEKSLGKATELTPKNLLAWISYARACEKTGNMAERDRAIKKAKQLAQQQKDDAFDEEEAVLPEAVNEVTPKSIQNMQVPE